jgi:hypothetical protein
MAQKGFGIKITRCCAVSVMPVGNISNGAIGTSFVKKDFYGNSDRKLIKGPWQRVSSQKFQLKFPKSNKTKSVSVKVVVEMLESSMPSINYAICVATNISITAKLVASEEQSLVKMQR